jgi:UDP-glucose 4-epimerase|tara:strand:+ start:1454 stop:2398 length:945 start_codon:yes stop_codon:yes gene_type:complete
MRILVTGAAGFIGSHLGEALLKSDHEVIGIDNFSNYYSKKIKEQNLSNAVKNPNFTFIHNDLATVDLSELGSIDIVFHEAAQPGVRKSWGKSFDKYLKDNIAVTQRLLEFFKDKHLQKFIFASSSSVYGDSESYPTNENIPLYPVSPYGVSKLASEYLCSLYYRNYQLPATMLRYFSVYGPRQRPDMLFNKAINAAITQSNISIYGNGNQLRDFTYIDDIISANLACLKKRVEGQIINIGGGDITSVNNAIKIIENHMDVSIKVTYTQQQRGDVLKTSADLTKAKKLLDYSPIVSIKNGLKNQIFWQQNINDNQ